MKMVGNVGVRVYSGRQEYCTQYSVLNVGYDRDGTIVEFTLLVPVVAISRESDYEMLKSQLKPADDHDKLVLSRTYSQKTWLVGDGLSKEEQIKASKGTLIIPYSQFPPKKVRKDCFYYTTPSMLTPKYLENVDSCEVSHILSVIVQKSLQFLFPTFCIVRGKSKFDC
nr:sterol desaturase-like protein [Tanacetum cinerariifolium]